MRLSSEGQAECSGEQLVSRHLVFLSPCSALQEGSLFPIVAQYLFVELN